jgi:hypothetical protein
MNLLQGSNGKKIGCSLSRMDATWALPNLKALP